MNMPFAYIMSCSEPSLGEFSLAVLNRLAEAKAARRDLEEQIDELEGTAQLIEWLRARPGARARLLNLELPQGVFSFMREEIKPAALPPRREERAMRLAG
ncbi:MAG TPA: hypothetical protein VN788_00050 [Verrucomicrobiae bacterium]|nr:hypothetical protein [Verrucomicrobiae bacterium]